MIIRLIRNTIVDKNFTEFPVLILILCDRNITREETCNVSKDSLCKVTATD